MTSVRFRPTLPGWLAALALVWTGLPAQAQTKQDQKNQRNSPGVVAAFKSVVAKPSLSTVRVLCDSKEVGLGTIVADDGWVITKASELKGKIVCKLKDGRTFDAVVRGVEQRHDLAMLKIEVGGLTPIEWRESKSAEVGNWVASPGTGADPVAVGVVSVATRRPASRELPMSPPPANSGYLGIGLEEGDGLPKIGMVAPESAAAKAGIKVGDIVLTVAGKKVPTPDQLVATIQTFKPGQLIKLQIKRGEEVKELEATLGKRPADRPNRSDFQNSMGSLLSSKRGGFPVILQHDTVIKPADCGGPLVDLDGKAVGINIARAGRTESYAIPTEAVLALLGDLKSGKLAPKVEEPPAKSVAELEKTLKDLSDQVKRLREELGTADARKKALEKQLEAIRKQQEDAQAALDRAKKDDTKK